MPDNLRLRQSPAPLQRLRRSTLLVAALVVMALVGLLAYAKSQIPPVSSWMAREQTPVPAPVSLPESLKAVERPYQELIPKPQPPIATPVPKPPPPPPPIVVPLPPPVQAQADPLPDFLDMMRKQQALSEKVAAQQQPPVTPPVPPQEAKKPVRQAWRIKPTDISIRKEGDKAKEGEVGKGEREAAGKKGEAEKLIANARWAIPASPLKTIYRSMVLNGRLLDSINSDIQASTIRIELTTPLWDKFSGENLILDKGTKIIASQSGSKLDFGQARLPLKIEQIELLNGTVLDLKAIVGDQEGAAGVTGKVDAHVGRVLLATGINAILNFGVRTVAGQPGVGYHYQNPGQQAAEAAGESIQRDTASYVDKVLKIPPTITIPSNTFCTISLQENVQLRHRPVVVR